MILCICKLKGFAEANSHEQKETWSKNIKTFWIYQNPSMTYLSLPACEIQADWHSSIAITVQWHSAIGDNSPGRSAGRSQGSPVFADITHPRQPLLPVSGRQALWPLHYRRCSGSARSMFYGTWPPHWRLSHCFSCRIIIRQQPSH